MRSRRGSDALHYSLAEFAYILLFLSFGALVLIAGRYGRAQEEIRALKEEVNFLNEILAEKENAVVPCWRRPDQTIPEIVGTITIHGATRFTLQRSRDNAVEAFAATEGRRDTIMQERLTALFQEERAYAEAKNCYIRMRIVNETNNFGLYKGMAEVVARLGIVLVNE